MYADVAVWSGGLTISLVKTAEFVVVNSEIVVANSGVTALLPANKRPFVGFHGCS